MSKKPKMSKVAKDILQGMKELKAYLDGDLSMANEYKVLPDGTVLQINPPPKQPAFSVIMAKIRKTLKMTREEIAEAFGLNKYSVRNWERGDREPPEYMKSYLKIIAADPWDAYKKLHS